MNKSGKVLLLLLLGFGLPVVAVSVIAMLIYWSQFGCKLSSSHEIWGQFSDFFGGILNPFIALLNLIAFIFLTYKIYRWQEAKEEEDTKHQDAVKKRDEEFQTELKQLENKLASERIQKEHELQAKIIRAHHYFSLHKELVSVWLKIQFLMEESYSQNKLNQIQAAVHAFISLMHSANIEMDDKVIDPKSTDNINGKLTQLENAVDKVTTETQFTSIQQQWKKDVDNLDAEVKEAVLMPIRKKFSANLKNSNNLPANGNAIQV